MQSYSNLVRKPVALKRAFGSNASMAVAAMYVGSIAVSMYSVLLSLPIMLSAMVLHGLSKSGPDWGWKSTPISTLSILHSVSQSQKSTSYSKVMHSIPSEFRYRSEIKSAMKRFKATGDAKFSFGKLVSNNDPSLSAIGIILYSAFSGGAGMAGASKWMKAKCSGLMGQIAKMAQISESSDTMIASGINFFFPIFAGITINILRFASPSGYKVYSTALIAMFLYYIMAVNYSTLSNSLRPRDGVVMRTLRMSALASLVMQAALRLSAFML
ncbi:hypothetical protein M1567_01205 [Candidatus Marsarchaeota archaeon]|jgi:hypothetical protein|nr:hypothetical protein [Candidatus Marsarchaeota archaeon]